MSEPTSLVPPEPAREAPVMTAVGVSAALMIALQAAVFMVSAEARVIAPLLPAIANDFGTTVVRVGSLITLYALPYGLFQLVYGPLADRFSRQRVMGAALALFSIGTLLTGTMPTLWALDVLRLCTGAAAAGVIPVALAYIGDAVPYNERQAALGRLISVSSLGGVLSAALGGIIATFVTWRVMFIGYGVLALVVATILLRLPVTRARPPETRQAGNLFDPYKQVFQQAGKRAWALYALVFYEGFIATGTQGYLGALLFDRDGLDYATIGGLLTLTGIASIVTARLVGRIVLRVGERGMLWLGGGLLTIAYILTTFQPTFVFFPIAMILAGCGFIIAHSTLQTRATELVPSMRGTAVALFAFSLFVGGALGTWLAGQGIGMYGYVTTLWATAAGLALFGIIGGVLIQVGQRART